MKAQRLLSVILSIFLCVSLVSPMAAAAAADSIQAETEYTRLTVPESFSTAWVDMTYNNKTSLFFKSFDEWWTGLNEGFTTNNQRMSAFIKNPTTELTRGQIDLDAAYPKNQNVVVELQCASYDVSSKLDVDRILTIQHSFYADTVTKVNFKDEIIVQEGAKLTFDKGAGTTQITSTPELTFEKPIIVNGELELVGGRADGTNPYEVKYTGTSGSFLTVAEGGKATIYSYQIEQSSSSDPLIVANGEVDFSVTAKNDLPSQIEASGTIIAVGENGSAKIGGGSFSTSSSTDAAITVADGGKLEISESVLGGSYSDVAPTITAQGAAAAIEVENGATLTLNGGEISATAAGTPAIQVASGGTIEIPADSKAVVTANDNSAQAIDLAAKSIVKKGDLEITVSEENDEAGDNYVDNYGNIILAAKSNEDGTVSAEKVILDDGTVIQSSEDKALDVGYETNEDGETVTQVTVPANGSVQKPDEDKATVLPGGGTVDGDSNNITVNVAGVTLDQTSRSLTKGGSVTLTATVSPEDATNKTVTWSSSDTDVATVDETGKVTAVGYGKATITATVDGKTATCTVTVPVPVEGVTVSPEKLYLYLGDTRQLTAKVSPDSATDQTLTWASSDTTVAKVDANGKVTAVAPGTATITVTTADGGKTATCTVTVKLYIPTKPSTPTDPTYAVNAPAVSHGAVTVSPETAAKGDTVTVTVRPDEGYELADLTVTDAKGDKLTLTDKGNGRFTFTMPDSKVTVSAAFSAVKQEPAPWTNPYTDVAEGVWYYDAVQYVTEHGLMGGADREDTFQPAMTTTRGMIMTILARMNGVNTEGGSTWYEKGMNWAVAAGVSDGTNPGGSITRQELVTMLWRYVGEPASSQSLSGYPDASATASWAADAMRWAVENGIITQTGEGLLNPAGTASRAEVATILMRFCENIVK